MSKWQKTSEGDFRRQNQHLASVGAPTKPSASTIFVDPAMARRVLAKNTHNRPIKESQVIRLMEEMTTGRWKYNGEAIKWSVDDVLLDGQHRLTALARMDDDFPAIPFLVVRGLPADTQSTMDQGTTRTAGDQLVLEGLLGSTDSRIVAGGIRVYLEWQRMAFFGDQKVASKISNPEVVAWASEHPVEMAILQDLASQRLRRVKCRPSVTLAVLLQFRLIDGEAAREFSEGLYSGAGLQSGNPILALRDRLDRIREGKVNVSDRDLIGYFVMAWNHWRRGGNTSKLQMPRGGAWTRESFPEAV
ncbi:hypothetical protein [Gordonia amicalis]|uniref:hypothetical protein n=1 Tax=Gordonia amicalis TaxID=89053 RepID=UPI0024B9AE8E|nr:hypothetical protein [Gordonia amicalis]MDJ0454373.1 hypothetical protein [Gordonia amicalis]MDV7077738.1 hypothetical protein [Gordonia amicalis]